MTSKTLRPGIPDKAVIIIHYYFEMRSGHIHNDWRGVANDGRHQREPQNSLKPRKHRLH